MSKTILRFIIVFAAAACVWRVTQSVTRFRQSASELIEHRADYGAMLECIGRALNGSAELEDVFADRGLGRYVVTNG